MGAAKKLWKTKSQILDLTYLHIYQSQGTSTKVKKLTPLTGHVRIYCRNREKKYQN